MLCAQNKIRGPDAAEFLYQLSKIEKNPLVINNHSGALLSQPNDADHPSINVLTATLSALSDSRPKRRSARLLSKSNVEQCSDALVIPSCSATDSCSSLPNSNGSSVTDVGIPSPHCPVIATNLPIVVVIQELSCNAPVSVAPSSDLCSALDAPPTTTADGVSIDVDDVSSERLHHGPVDICQDNLRNVVNRTPLKFPSVSTATWESWNESIKTALVERMPLDKLSEVGLDIFVEEFDTIVYNQFLDLLPFRPAVERKPPSMANYEAKLSNWRKRLRKQKDELKSQWRKVSKDPSTTAEMLKSLRKKWHTALSAHKKVRDLEADVKKREREIETERERERKVPEV